MGFVALFKVTATCAERYHKEERKPRGMGDDESELGDDEKLVKEKRKLSFEDQEEPSSPQSPTTQNGTSSDDIQLDKSTNDTKQDKSESEDEAFDVTSQFALHPTPSKNKDDEQNNGTRIPKPNPSTSSNGTKPPPQF
eukprot:TRINITY_DN1358_c0_g1_i1.p1 TRINITY_DN1358_c0_g1~~TRINITY_DN1358_c0_g1_i1.p1  ORF type:complete len:138 (-),score=21.36 TRINITY_DN1358_c0_g1_i1:126-539(-)